MATQSPRRKQLQQGPAAGPTFLWAELSPRKGAEVGGPLQPSAYGGGGPAAL